MGRGGWRAGAAVKSAGRIAGEPGCKSLLSLFTVRLDRSLLCS